MRPLFLAKLGTAALSVCVTMLALEVGIRIFYPQDLGFWDSHAFRRVLPTSPHFVENIPNGRAIFTGVPVSINRDGLRGDENSSPKPPHNTRILVVGDSITFGYGIPIQDTYAKALERRLNEAPADDTRYEVLNGGTLGASLSDYLHFLNQKAELLQPDIVLIGLCLNDILVYSEAGVVLEGSTQWGGRLPRARRFNSLVLRHSQLYTLVYGSLKSTLYGSGVLDINKVQGLNFVAVQPASAYQTQAWASSREMLLRIIAFCRERNYRLVVAVFPMQMQMSPAEFKFCRERLHLQLGDGALSGEPQRRLQGLAATLGFTLIDLLPVYRVHSSEDLYLRNKMIPYDPTHPSVRGNQIAADEIFRVLKNQMQRARVQ